MRDREAVVSWPAFGVGSIAEVVVVFDFIKIVLAVPCHDDVEMS